MAVFYVNQTCSKNSVHMECVICLCLCVSFYRFVSSCSSSFSQSNLYFCILFSNASIHPFISLFFLLLAFQALVLSLSLSLFFLFAYLLQTYLTSGRRPSKELSKMVTVFAYLPITDTRVSVMSCIFKKLGTKLGTKTTRFYCIDKSRKLGSKDKNFAKRFAIHKHKKTRRIVDVEWTRKSAANSSSAS